VRTLANDGSLVHVPRLIPPRRRSLVGGVYAATLLFEFFVKAGGRAGARRLCEQRTILVEATSGALALREAKRQGHASAYQYKNSDGNPVRFRFVGVLDLLHLGGECQPNEVWYSIKEYVRPMERRKAILPRERDLSAIRNERASSQRKTSR